MPTETRTPRPLDDADVAELAERWHAVLPHQEAMGAALVERYREPWRRYHDARHLLAVLRQVDALAGDQDLFLVRLGGLVPRRDLRHPVPRADQRGGLGPPRAARAEPGRARAGGPHPGRPAGPAHRRARAGQPRRRGRAALRRRPGRAGQPARGVRRLRRRRSARSTPSVPDEEFWAARFEVLEPWVEGEIYRTGKGKLLTPAARANVTAEVAADRRAARHRASEAAPAALVPVTAGAGRPHGRLRRPRRPADDDQDPSDRPEGWWRNAVVYQIYPRSFADSNGDGTGDIPGIIATSTTSPSSASTSSGSRRSTPRRWTTTATTSPTTRTSTRCSGRWRTWTSCSPRPTRRGIKILMDLVVNHTSDEHPWFVESRRPGSAKRDWYWWRPARDGPRARARPGAEPTNWASAFSGPAWHWDEEAGAYYLHLFTRKQPDLNWENPDVREAVYAMMRWWVARGVDGFRMDVINLISKPTELRRRAAARGQPYGERVRGGRQRAPAAGVPRRDERGGRARRAPPADRGGDARLDRRRPPARSPTRPTTA